jgi:hypothetical protein
VCVHCLTKADSHGADGRRDVGETPTAPGHQLRDFVVGQETRPPEELPEAARTEWYELDAYETYIVTFETALYVERQLERLPEPRWIEFRDVFGARHRIKTSYVGRFAESTPASRAAKRAFDRARQKEDWDPECGV